MKIFYDENIPFASEFFADFGELTAFSGRELTAQQVSNADVLLVRSITPVNAELLHLNQTIKFVGTATIGFDHIDQEYLQQRNIAFSNAPGCNAVSVAEYVLSSIMVLAERYQFNLLNKTIGIVGAGNTGSALAKKLDALGINYLLSDPILASQGDLRKFSSLEQVLACDIISLHVPLTKHGNDATLHLLNADRLGQLTGQQILINACRGEVIDNQALLTLKQQQLGPKVVLDVWENEPNVLTELISHCEITTAHIAGYSLEGKSRGTEMLYLALSKLLASEVKYQLSEFLPKASFNTLTALNKSVDSRIASYIFNVYDVRRDDKIFRKQLTTTSFDYLRKNYPVRREFSALELTCEQTTSDSDLLKNLGFNIK